eukprot:scaffold1950_cov366-Prasinococcus_capsulatus_cf.AAC.4
MQKAGCHSTRASANARTVKDIHLHARRAPRAHLRPSARHFQQVVGDRHSRKARADHGKLAQCVRRVTATSLVASPSLGRGPSPAEHPGSARPAYA